MNMPIVQSYDILGSSSSPPMRYVIRHRGSVSSNVVDLYNDKINGVVGVVTMPQSYPFVG